MKDPNDKYNQDGFDEFGRQICDPTPIEVPLKFRNAESREEMITRLIRQELSRAAERQGFESLEEADDFDFEEDPEPLSNYELQPMQEEEPLLAEQKQPANEAEKHKATPVETQGDVEKEPETEERES